MSNACKESMLVSQLLKKTPIKNNFIITTKGTSLPPALGVISPFNGHYLRKSGPQIWTSRAFYRGGSLTGAWKDSRIHSRWTLVDKAAFTGKAI